ncbi:MAG: hypothetical protein O2829_01245 [Bacteroidetes bacterium]|nr:hypothetical protein [Bacteroidota bacterium]
MRIYQLLPLFFLILWSCSCAPEKIAEFAFNGMEGFLGEGFLPSEEIRGLGKFESTSVTLSKSTEGDTEESIIFLKLQNGDPQLMADQREQLARNCAELYLRDFENANEYTKITIQFVQTDSYNPENISVEEYTFEVKDF